MRLSRAGLLELLILQTKERERLEQKLEEAEQCLADRELRLEKAGDIAQAALQINGVMEAAQAAARQYLENVERLERRTRNECEQLLQKARKDADEIRRRASPQPKKKQNRVK